MEADKLRFARAHLRRSEQTSYALTRRYAWLPTIESDEHKTKCVDTFVEDAESAALSYRFTTSFAKRREAFE
jgi:hypothetical protein